MTKPETLQPEGVAPPLGQYSHVSRMRASELVFVAGQVPVDEGGEIVDPDDLDAQVRQVFGNLERCLAAGGASLASIMKFTTYLTRVEDLEDFRRIRSELFAEIYPDGRYPANTLLVVTRLASPAFRVEIEAVAAT